MRLFLKAKCEQVWAKDEWYENRISLKATYLRCYSRSKSKSPFRNLEFISRGEGGNHSKTFSSKPKNKMLPTLTAYSQKSISHNRLTALSKRHSSLVFLLDDLSAQKLEFYWPLHWEINTISLTWVLLIMIWLTTLIQPFSILGSRLQDHFVEYKFFAYRQKRSNSKRACYEKLL